MEKEVLRLFKSYLGEKSENFSKEGLKYGILIPDTASEEIIKECLDNNFDLDIRSDLVTKELVDRFHEKGLIVNCWTVDSVDELKRVTKCGVDMVTSNVFEEE